jgi:hypothetical protein
LRSFAALGESIDPLTLLTGSAQVHSGSTAINRIRARIKTLEALQCGPLKRRELAHAIRALPDLRVGIVSERLETQTPLGRFSPLGTSPGHSPGLSFCVSAGTEPGDKPCVCSVGALCQLLAHGLGERTSYALIGAAVLVAGRQAKVAVPNEFDDLPPQKKLCRADAGPREQSALGGPALCFIIPALPDAWVACQAIGRPRGGVTPPIRRWSARGSSGRRSCRWQRRHIQESLRSPSWYSVSKDRYL